MKKIALVSIVALFVMGFASAAFAQGSVSGTYWLPGTWTVELNQQKYTIPGRGLSLSGDFAFSDRFGVAFGYASLSDSDKLELKDGTKLAGDASFSATTIDASYRLYSDPAFVISPTLGYFMSSTTVQEGTSGVVPKATVDVSGFKVGAKFTANLMEGLEGYVSGGYAPSLTIKSGDVEEKGTATEFTGGVKYAIKLVPNLYFDGGYKYISMATEDGADTLFKSNTSGFYAGVSYKF